MHLLTKIFLFLFGFFLSCFGHHVDFCDKKMCPYQGTHVACNKTKDFGPQCEGQPELEDMNPYIPMILDQHNFYRNLTASGEVKCFYPAVRMPFVHWDWDLAEMAEYNVRSCIFAHDDCRSTTRFPMAGQNIYMAKTVRLSITIAGFIEEAIFLWFEEQFDADHTVLQSYHKTRPQTGHFTLLVTDRIYCLGCALVKVYLPGSIAKLLVILTCNYSSTNIRGIPSYKPGPAASKCKKRHYKYTALCLDPIDSNDLTWYDDNEYE